MKTIANKDAITGTAERSSKLSGAGGGGDHFFCFIPPSLGAKYEFKYIENGLFTFLLVHLYFFRKKRGQPPISFDYSLFCPLFDQLIRTHGFQCLAFTLINSKCLQ